MPFCNLFMERPSCYACTCTNKSVCVHTYTKPYYGHYISQPVLAGIIQNWIIFL